MTNREERPAAESESESTPEKPYDREEKLKELLEQDQAKDSPWADPFMGF